MVASKLASTEECISLSLAKQLQLQNYEDVFIILIVSKGNFLMYVCV